MDFLREMLAPTVNPRNPLSEFWFGPIGRKVSSGVDVNDATAFQYSAVWAASRLLSDTISTLPRFLYRRERQGKSKATGHPTFNMFSSEPNKEQGGVNHFAQQTNFVVNWGNCYAELVKDRFDRVIEMWPIHPSRIKPWNIKRNRLEDKVDIPEGDTGELVYFVMNDKGPPTPVLKRNMLHVPGSLSEDGITGKGVITQAAESIGMGLATERFGGSFFGNGSSPAIVLSHPMHISEEAVNTIRNSWRQRFSDPGNANGLLVIEEDMKIERLTIPPEQAQFLQTRQFNITEIARWYNLPVHLLREMSKSSFNNIESENLHYVVISIMPWLVRWEDELNRQMLVRMDKGAYFFKFMLQGLLRGDMESRAKFYREMWFMGVFSINDILELEDRNTIGPQGDVRYIQSAMIPIEMAGQQQPQQQAPMSVDGLLPMMMKSIESRDVIAVDSVKESREETLSRIDDMAATLSGHMVPKEYFDKHFSGLHSEVIKISAKLDKTNEMIGSLDKLSNSAADKLLGAAKDVFRCEFGRIVRKEAKGARWAAQEPREFMSRLDSWFEKHRESYQTAELTSVFEAMGALGVEHELAGFAEIQIESSYTELIEKSGEATMETLATVIDEVADGWENEKTDVITDLIFNVTEN